MKKLLYILLILPNLSISNELISNENFRINIIKNTKTLSLKSISESADFTVSMYELKGISKNLVDVDFNKDSKILNLSKVRPGNYIISTRNNDQYVDYLIGVMPNQINIIDEKEIQKPIINIVDKKMSIIMLEKKSKVLVSFENNMGKILFSNYFSSKELDNKVFNIENIKGISNVTIIYDYKTFENKLKT